MSSIFKFINSSNLAITDFPPNLHSPSQAQDLTAHSCSARLYSLT